MINIQSLTLDTNILSLGSILGTNGSQELINTINERSGSGSFFSSMADPFRTGFANFMKTVVEPIRNVGIKLENTAQQLLMPDKFKAITSEKDLKKGIPPCMQLGVVYFEPVRKMLDEERIDGFGISSETLMKEDPYAKVLASDYIEIHSSFLDADHNIVINHYENTIDPDLEPAEIEALRRTREYIANFINDEDTAAYDVTCYPELHT